MRTEEEFITKIKELLVEEHERPAESFDNLIPKMKAAYAAENGVSDKELEVIFLGSDDEDLLDKLADRYPMTNEIAASLYDEDGEDEEDDDDDDDDEDD